MVGIVGLIHGKEGVANSLEIWTWKVCKFLRLSVLRRSMTLLKTLFVLVGVNDGRPMLTSEKRLYTCHRKLVVTIDTASVAHCFGMCYQTFRQNVFVALVVLTL